MKFIRIFFSVIISIVFVAVLSFGIFGYTINSFMSKDNVKRIMEGVGYEKFLELDIENPEIYERYLEIPEVKELVDKLMGQSIEYMINNKSIPKVQDEDIEKIVNSNYYETKLGITWSKEEKLEYSESLKEAYSDVNKSLEIDMAQIRSELFENDVLKVILSKDFLPTIYISLIVLTILLIVFNWSWYRPFSWIGVSMIISGGLNIIVYIIVDEMLSAEASDYATQLMTDGLLSNWLNYGIMVLFLGCVLFFNYFILKNKFGNNKEEKLLDSL